MTLIINIAIIDHANSRTRKEKAVTNRSGPEHSPRAAGGHMPDLEIRTWARTTRTFSFDHFHSPLTSFSPSQTRALYLEITGVIA